MLRKYKRILIKEHSNVLGPNQPVLSKLKFLTLATPRGLP